MTRHKTLLAILAVTATFGATATTIGQSADLEPAQLRVVWSIDPAHRAIVSWSTAAEGSEHVIHYDVEARDGVLGDYAFNSPVVISGEYKTDGPFFHHATIEDLPANTDIFFSVVTDGNPSDELYFRTAPDGDETVKFLYGGDSRTGRANRQEMNRLISRLHDEDPEIAALVHGGDYIAFANNWPQWTAWLDDHELTIGPDGRVLPIVPAKGNHEGRGTIYNFVFGEPSGDPQKNWFYTRFGQVALINLDTEVSLAGEQREWLRERLAEGREAPWLLVNYHRPAFPAVKSPSGAREHWVPLFEEFNVDLVCESDGHALKRTPPIRNERVDATGVVYVGEGGLGVPRRTPKTDRWYLQAPGMSAKAHHVQKIELTPDLLRYQALLMDGTVADEMTILPHEQRVSLDFTAIEARAPSPRHIEVVFSRPFDPVTAIEQPWETDPNVEIERVEIGDQVQAVLDLANTADLETLDVAVGLDVRAARNIIAFRAGEDEVLDTDDDLEFETWAELDAISFVGKTALAAMTSFALDAGTNEHNVVTLHLAEDLEEGETYTISVPAVADRDGEVVADGTTIDVVYMHADDRADAIAGGAPVADETASGGCSTAGSRHGTDLSWLLFVMGFWSVRRCRTSNSISSANRKTTAGFRSRR